MKCIFSGWPLPPVANWFREEKLITNESKAVYQLDRILGKEGNKTLHSSLNFQVAREDQAGFYKCNATNSIPGWSSSKSKMIQTIYQCKYRVKIHSVLKCSIGFLSFRVTQVFSTRYAQFRLLEVSRTLSQFGVANFDLNFLKLE